MNYQAPNRTVATADFERQRALALSRCEKLAKAPSFPALMLDGTRNISEREWRASV